MQIATIGQLAEERRTLIEAATALTFILWHDALISDRRNEKREQFKSTEKARILVFWRRERK